MTQFKALTDAGKLQVEIRENRMIVRLGDKILFDPGKTDLKPEGKDALTPGDRGAEVAAEPQLPGRRPHRQRADQVEAFRSNWDLSTARAVEVTNFMIGAGMEPKRLSAAGYADQSPVAPNDTPDNMAKNRRIEITLVPNLDDLPPIDDALKGDAPAPARRGRTRRAIRPARCATVLTSLRPPVSLRCCSRASWRSPPGPRAASACSWRAWYQFLAARYPDPRWTFMNYGYRAPEATAAQPPLALEAADEDNRSCIQLYDLVARGAPVAGRELLEVGCGRGGGADYVARKLDPRRVVAVDLSPRAVALCRRRFAHPRLSFEVGDAERLPFDDASFDVVLNVESSHCYGRFDAFLARGPPRAAPRRAFPLRRLSSARRRSTAGGQRSSPPASRSAPSSDLRPGVVAALDADDGEKRDLIARLIDRPLAGIFGEFAALQGSELNAALRSGDFGYRAFVLTPTLEGARRRRLAQHPADLGREAAARLVDDERRLDDADGSSTPRRASTSMREAGSPAWGCTLRVRSGPQAVRGERRECSSFDRSAGRIAATRPPGRTTRAAISTHSGEPQRDLVDARAPAPGSATAGSSRPSGTAGW